MCERLSERTNERVKTSGWAGGRLAGWGTRGLGGQDRPGQARAGTGRALGLWSSGKSGTLNGEAGIWVAMNVCVCALTQSKRLDNRSDGASILRVGSPSASWELLTSCHLSSLPSFYACVLFGHEEGKGKTGVGEFPFDLPLHPLPRIPAVQASKSDLPLRFPCTKGQGPLLVMTDWPVLRSPYGRRNYPQMSFRPCHDLKKTCMCLVEQWAFHPRHFECTQLHDSTRTPCRYWVARMASRRQQSLLPLLKYCTDFEFQ